MTFKANYLFAILSVIPLIGLFACQSGPSYKETLADPLGEMGTIIGKSKEDRPIRIYTMGDGPEELLVMATIHGNENAGTPITMSLIGYLKENPQLLEGKKVIFLPVTNPDGYFHNRRFNMSDVDLNRNFPADNRRESRRSGDEALSEPEAQAIYNLLNDFNFTRIVSMHEPLECIDYDGPAQEIAEHMGKYTDLPVNKLGARPGSLGSYAGVTKGIPIITLEFPRGAGRRNPDVLWKEYGKSVLAFISYPEDL